MIRYIVLQQVGDGWLADGGTVRRVLSSTDDLLASLREADREESPTIGADERCIRVEKLAGGWLVSETGQKLLVRENAEHDADRLWAMLFPVLLPKATIKGLGDAVESAAYGGSSEEKITVEVFGSSFSMSRGQLRQVSGVKGILAQIGRAISISPESRRRQRERGHG